MHSLQAAQTHTQAEDEPYVQGQSSAILIPVPVQNGIYSRTWVSREGTGQYCQVSLTCSLCPSFLFCSERSQSWSSSDLHPLLPFPWVSKIQVGSQPLEKFGMQFTGRRKLIPFLECTHLVHLSIQPDFLEVTAGVSFDIRQQENRVLHVDEQVQTAGLSM